MNIDLRGDFSRRVFWVNITSSNITPQADSHNISHVCTVSTSQQTDDQTVRLVYLLRWYFYFMPHHIIVTVH